MISLIAILILLALLLVIILLYNKTKKDNTYEFSTGISKLYLVIELIFFGLGILFLTISFTLSFDTDPDSAIGQWVLFGFGLFFGLFGILLLYMMFFEKEHILGDEIIVRRFFRKKHIKIKDVKLIQRIPRGLFFFGENQKKLFSMDAQSKGLSEFIHLLVVKSQDLNCSFILEVDGIAQASNTTLDPTNEEHREEIDKYIEIGKEYKKDYFNRLKDLKLTTAGIIVAGLLYSLSFAIVGGILMLIIIGGMTLFVAISQYKKIKARLGAELNKPDFELGQSYAHKSDVVIGNSKKKYTSQIVTASVILVLVLINAIAFFASTNPYKPKYDELTKITGKFDYAYEGYDDSDEEYIAFGFNTSIYSISTEYKTTEYRLPEFCLETFDYSLFDIDLYDEDGNYISHDMVLYVDKSEVFEEESEFDENKTKYYRIYGVEIDRKVYFDFDMCDEAYDIYNTKLIVSGVILCVLAISTIIFIALHVVKKEQAKKKEYIKI